MNAKKKNKKANKPANSNPPQSPENVSKCEENIQETKPKCEVKEEAILTPEKCSEIVATPISDTTETEIEMPKKPKRNKGKKKNQDKNEDLMENVQDKEEVQSEINIQVQEPVQQLEAEKKENEEKIDPLNEAHVVPSARKKKNKKKSQEKPTEETKISDNVSVPVHKEEAKINPESVITTKIDPEMQELFSSTPETIKQDVKKKKNKKKKRTDSERSDKSDNVVPSCTSAFQKLLAEDEQGKPDTVVENNPEFITSPQLKPNSEKTDKNIETHLVEEIEELIKVKPLDIKEFPKDESKSKKKNKKDKKQTHEEIVEGSKPNISLEIPVLEDITSQKILSDELKPDIKESIEVPFYSNMEKEPSPKPKAKIAKPVEKKRKGKLEAHSSENLSNIESSEIVKEEKKYDELSKETELKLEEIPPVNIVEPQYSDQITEKTPVTPKAIENINVPSDSAMGKKRKKSPKPPKTKEARIVKADDIDLPEKIQSEKVAESKEPIITLSDLIQVEIQNVSSKLEETPSKVSEVPSKEMLKLQEHQKLDVAEIKLIDQPPTSEIKIDNVAEPKTIDQPPTPEMKIDNEGFETKTSKKKKKTPKVPQVEITSELKEPIEPFVIQKKEDDKENTKQFTEGKMDLDVSPSADLEVRSLRTESEASSCDAIPDILFMRSSSQQLLDSNNNTVIQELLVIDEIKLNDPLLIPVIESSGETPICTSEPVSFGIRITEVEPKTSTEEKTDIKSKMMEVNQDMEELRLSIERSLAEFTALEKFEHESDTKLETETLLEKEKSPLKDKKTKSKRSEEAKEVIEMESTEVKTKDPEKLSPIPPVEVKPSETPPVCPARKDNKGKSKSKKKGKIETTPASTTAVSSDSSTTPSQTKDNAKEEVQKSEQKSEQKAETTQEKGKQQSDSASSSNDISKDLENIEQHMNSELIFNSTEQNDFEPIENFEDALSSSNDDVNKTFEMIVKDADNDNIEIQKKLGANKPEINITEATDDSDTNRNEKVNPVSQPKNLLGQIDIPVQSNKTDYKKEKNKTPNARQARVKIKDSMDVETKKQSKESQTESKRAGKNSDKSVKESFSRVKNDNEEYVYKYSFRKVFLQSACHVCNKDLKQFRVPCGYCTLVFYCGAKHKDEDWPQHQALCFAVSTLAHMKDQKHVYADAQHATGQDYRLLRMQMIVSCEKVLKRRLVPWEQEAMLYPRICADVACREWRQGKLKDCDGCGQLSYCAAHPEHLPKSHSRWCNSYSLYRKLVSYQQTKGRLEPHLPTKVMKEYEMSGKMNEVLAALYEEKIDMNDIQYASLTQLATAPLTAAYCLQLCRSATGITNGFHKKQPFTIHVVGAELQFEADALNKWEKFFLHLRPDVEELRVVLVSPMLNPGNLPLDLLGRIKLCDNCLQNKRRVVFKFEDNMNYFEYRSSEYFINPDIICAFNPSIQRSSVYNGKDPWPATINSILKLKQPFIVTSYTLNELRKDIARIKEVAEMDFKLVSEAGFNSFASVRPDRNFISDDEMPLLFKNYCVAVLLGC